MNKEQKEDLYVSLEVLSESLKSYQTTISKLGDELIKFNSALHVFKERLKELKQIT